MTLHDFLHANQLCNNSFVQHDSFLELYLRIGPRYVDISHKLVYLDRVLQIARVAAKVPKTGALRQLVGDVDRISGCKLPIYIENLYNSAAAQGILRSDLGFMEVDQKSPHATCLLRPAVL